jgi:transcriptional regulator GlxA family with amidase domain
MRHSGKTPTPVLARRRKPVGDDGAALVGMLDDSGDTAGESSGDSAVELRVGIVLWPKFPLLSLAGLCDALRHAADVGDQSRQVRCTWSVLGVPGRAVAASCGIEVPVQESLATDSRFDYIAVIGGLLPSIGDVDRRYVDFLKRVDDEGTPVIGICTGVFVLARHGLLNGKRMCVHPFHEQDWLRLHPTLPYVTHRHYHADGNRLSCAGGLSIIELAAELIRLHCGSDRSAKVIHQMTVSQKAMQTHVARRHALGYATVESDALRKAVMLMEKNISTPLEIGVIARLVDVQPKQLERVFQKETGQSPSEFYRNSRLKYGRWLLGSSDMAVSEIAFECGFADAPHFIRHFQQLYGMSPGRLRLALVSTPVS